MADQVTTFVFDTARATPEAAKLADALTQIKKSQDELNFAFQRGDLFLDQYRTKMAALEKDAARLQTSLNKVQFVDPSKAFAGKGDGLFGYSKGDVKQFARLADDLQYVGQQGLRPITGQLVELNPLWGVAAIGAQKLGEAVHALSGYLSEYLDGLKQLVPEQSKQIELFDLAQQVTAGGGPKAGLAFVDELLKQKTGTGLGDRVKNFLGIGGIEGPAKAITEGEEQGRKIREGITTDEMRARQEGLKFFMEENKESLQTTPGSQAERDIFLGLSEASKGTEAGIVRLQGALRGLGRGGAADLLGETVRGFMPEGPDDPNAVLERQNKLWQDGGKLLKQRRQEEKDNLYEQQMTEFDLSNERARERRKEREEDNKLRRKGEIDQAQGRLKWLRTLQEREDRPAQMFGDALSFQNALLTAGTAKGDGLDRTNSYLERMVKLEEQNLEALRNFPANLGP